MRSREGEVEVERQEGTKPLGLEWSLFFFNLNRIKGKGGRFVGLGVSGNQGRKRDEER